MSHEQRDADGVLFSDDPARLDLERAHGWISGESYWAAGIPWETFRRSAANSLSVGVYDGENGMIGFARVISDRATFAWLCDVWIAEGSRGSGLGERLVGWLMAHPELQGLRRWSLATRDAHGLYRRFGFEAADAARGMERKDPDIYRRG